MCGAADRIQRYVSAGLFPPGYLNPVSGGVHEKDGESALGLAAQGACLHRLCLTHAVMMWPERPRLPRSRAYVHRKRT